MNDSSHILEFEKPLYELENRIDEMKNFAVTENLEALNQEIQRLEKELSLARQ